MTCRNCFSTTITRIRQGIPDYSYVHIISGRSFYFIVYNISMQFVSIDRKISRRGVPPRQPSRADVKSTTAGLLLLHSPPTQVDREQTENNCNNSGRTPERCGLFFRRYYRLTGIAYSKYTLITDIRLIR